jgi:hypothetical protein
VSKIKTPQKEAGTKLRELSKKRREGMKPSKELFSALIKKLDGKKARNKREREE